MVDDATDSVGFAVRFWDRRIVANERWLRIWMAAVDVRYEIQESRQELLAHSRAVVLLRQAS